MNKTHRFIIIRSRRFLVPSLLALGAILAVGCSESNAVTPTEPSTGALLVQVSTVSAAADLDTDGYLLIIDDAPGLAVQVNSELSVGALRTGNHQARLDGVALQCTVSGRNPRTVYVGTAKAPSPPVSFDVSCSDNSGAGGWDY